MFLVGYPFVLEIKWVGRMLFDVLQRQRKVKESAVGLLGSSQRSSGLKHTDLRSRIKEARRI